MRLADDDWRTDDDDDPPEVDPDDAAEAAPDRTPFATMTAAHLALRHPDPAAASAKAYQITRRNGRMVNE